jgi:hypothetical protein
MLESWSSPIKVPDDGTQSNAAIVKTFKEMRITMAENQMLALAPHPLTRREGSPGRTLH